MGSGEYVDMKLRIVPTLGALIVGMCIASISAAPANARTICKGQGASAKCQTVKANKRKFAKAAKIRRAVARPRRVSRLENAWHGWAGSFHLDGVRYPGGNPSGPAAAYNNYEGGFHNSAFWVLSNRYSY